MVLGAMLWVGAYGMDFILIHQTWHKVFVSIVHIGVALSGLGAILASLEFTQNGHRITRTLWVFLSVQPILMFIAVILDPIFHTLISDSYIITVNDRIQWKQELSYFTLFLEFGITGIWTVYVFFFVIKSILETKPPARYRYYLLLFTCSIVWIAGITNYMGFKPIAGLNLTSVALSFQVIVIFFAIAYYRMFDLIPLVRGEVVDELEEPVVILDANNRVVDWNIAAEQLFVEGRRQLAFTSAQNFFHTYSDLSHRIETLPEKRTHTHWNWQSKNPTQEWEVRAKRIRDKQRVNIGLVIVFRDISEQKKLEVQMADANRNLLFANGTKDRFLSIISHDLRGPLAGIKMLLKILNEDMKEKDAKIAEMTQSLVDASESVFSLLETLLSWSKLQRGQEEFHPHYYKLDSIVSESVELFELNAKNKSIEFEIDVPSHAMVYCDDRMIFTILRNLISNAIKFSHKNSKVKITAQAESKFWRVNVIDFGMGIAPDIRAKLFHVGEVIKSLGTQGESGNGVGLLLCQEFILMNAGEIEVQSDGVSGSTFSFTIPSQPV